MKKILLIFTFVFSLFSFSGIKEDYENAIKKYNEKKDNSDIVKISKSKEKSEYVKLAKYALIEILAVENKIDEAKKELNNFIKNETLSNEEKLSAYVFYFNIEEDVKNKVKALDEIAKLVKTNEEKKSLVEIYRALNEETKANNLEKSIK